MPIGEYLRTHTRTQHRMLLAWLENRMNVPDRADWYSMQLAVILDAILARLPGSTPATKLSTKQIKFGEQPKQEEKKYPVKPLTKEDIVKIKIAIARDRAKKLKGDKGSK